MTQEDLVGSVRRWLIGWGAEVAGVQIETARRRFSPDLVAFGTHADAVVGLDAVVAEQWSKVWPTIDAFRFHAEDALVQLSPDGHQAVIVTTWSSTGTAANGVPFRRPGRATVVLRRDGEAWLGTHTHFSLARGVPDRSFGTRPT